MKGHNTRSFDPYNSNRRNRQTRSDREQVMQHSEDIHRQRIRVKESAQLLDFLMQKLAGQSATSVKNLLKHRCVLINEGEIVTQFDYPLEAGDVVSILSTKEAKYGLFHPLIRILYEDDFILAVEKKSGLLSVDVTGGGADNAAAILDQYVKRRDPNKRIYIVHRLDRDTSGVMLFAKCREAQTKLVADWNDRVLERTYIAITEGTPEPARATIDRMLYQDDHMIVHVTDDPKIGLRAITHYKVLSQNAENARVQCDLETGRTNQIRVHMQSIGHPLVGDEKYGAVQNPLGRLGLHALNIKFYHPITQKVMSFEVPEPNEFSTLFDN